MGFMEITEKMLNSAFTENGDKAYHTSGSYCLDYFALVGGMRFNLSDALNHINENEGLLKLCLCSLTVIFHPGRK